MDDKQSLKSFLSNLSKLVDTPVSQVKDFDASLDVSTIPSGSYALDFALGVGGLPRGRIIEVFGRESGGKTLLSLLAIAQAQKAGGIAAFVDVEGSFDKKWARMHGVDVDNLIFCQPSIGEQALNVVEELVKSGKVDLVVLDSVASLVPQAEMEADLVDQQMGLQARLMSKGLRRLNSLMAGSKAIVIFINQLRDTMSMYGEKETTPGGRALKFYSSIRLSVKRVSGSDIKEGNTVVGHTVNITVKKNKVGPPFTEAQFVLRYRDGIDKVEELCTLADLHGVIVQKGPMTSFKDKSWKGHDAFVEALRKDEALQKDIWSAIKSSGVSNEGK